MSFIKSYKIHTFLIISAVLLAVFVGVSMVKAAPAAGYQNMGLGCQNKEECREVCLTKYPTECIYYHPELTTELLLEIKEVLNEAAEAFAREGGPNGCGTEGQCVQYCSNQANYPECQAYYMGPLWYWTNNNILDIAPLWGGKIIPAIITAMDKNIEPPAECRNDYANDHLSCIDDCSSSTDDEGNRSASCNDFLTEIGYFSEDDFELEAKLKELEQKGETGGCNEGLSYCFDITGFYALCALSEDPVACFALADKYDLAPEEDIELGKLVAPFLKSGQTPGKCENLRECRAYCSIEANYDECVEFVEKFDLPVEVPDDQKAVVAAIEKGDAPGGCTDEVSCRAYCEDVDHIGECVDFVEKFNLASDDDLKEMRKMADLKKAGVAFPGNCKTKESCLKYCDNSANAVVCMEFALKAGFIPKEDAEAVGKILPYLKSGGKLPGGCTTKESCDTYCNNDTHTNECVDFAVGAGFMTKEDADIVKKVGGKGPGNCRSKEACENYCKDEAHIDECVDFAVKAGFISEADAADAKKYKITSGPGNCKSKADCEAFCVLPENQDTCFKFAKEHGMISEEDLKNIEQYRNQGPPDFSQVNPKWLACMEKEMGSAAFGRFKAGKSDRSDVSAIQAAQKKCQSEMGPDTKECLAKPTCEEFFSCLNPSGSRTSQQGGPGQEPPPELKKRMDSCQDELKETKKKEVQEKFDACFTLSCSEYEACMKSIEQSGDQQDGQQQAQGTPDPKIKAKAEACQKEKINACLSKPCGEFQACINSLGGGAGGGGTPDPAVQAKFQSCQPPPSSGDSGGQQQSGDQSGIPQGYSSWQEFCTANYSDSRCAR